MILYILMCVTQGQSDCSSLFAKECTMYASKIQFVKYFHYWKIFANESCKGEKCPFALVDNNNLCICMFWSEPSLSISISYRIYPEYWVILSHSPTCPKFSTSPFYYLQVDVLKLITPYSSLFWPNFCSFIQLFLKILSEMANSVDPDQTAVWSGSTVCICNFVRHFGVQNFKALTVSMSLKH